MELAIGPLPILGFLLGVVEFVKLILLKRAITRDSIWFLILFGAGMPPFFAFLMNWGQAKDHSLFNYFVLLIPVAVAWVLFWTYVIVSAPLGSDTHLSIGKFSTFNRLARCILGIVILMVIITLYNFMLPVLKTPTACQGSKCFAGEFLFGSKKFSYGTLAMFSFFSSMAIAGIIGNATVLFSRKSNK